MTKEEIFIKVQKIFRDTLRDETLELTFESSGDNVDDWDSFTNIQITMEVEKFFNIRFALADLEDLDNIGDFVDLIGKRI